MIKRTIKVLLWFPAIFAIIIYGMLHYIVKGKSVDPHDIEEKYWKL